MAAVSGADPSNSIVDAQNRSMAFSALSVVVNERINRHASAAKVAQGASDQTLDAAKQAGQSMAHALKSN
jgi:hypothetical protein